MNGFAIAGLVFLAVVILLVSAIVGLLLQDRAQRKAAARAANADVNQLKVIEEQLRSLEIKKQQGREWSRIDDEDYAQLIHARNRMNLRIAKRRAAESAAALQAA